MLDNEYEIGGLTFGNGRDYNIIVQDVDLGTAEWATQDVDNPVGDGMSFGRDVLRSPSWIFSLLISADDGPTARAILDQLARVWRDRTLAKTPGASIPLRFRVAGQERRVYGRPRNFAVDDWSGLDQGIVDLTAEFRLQDPLIYDDTERSMTVTLLPSTAGGLSGVLKGNLKSLGSGQRAGIVTVPGDIGSPMIVEFTGPVTDPLVRSTGWVLGLTGRIEYDQTVTIDTRTHTVTRNDGASVGGMLSRATYLDDVRLQPGTQEIVFEGTSETGTATATVRWRTAYESI